VLGELEGKLYASGRGAPLEAERDEKRRKKRALSEKADLELELKKP
jgi:hypothetical protein